jgi:hypothetical protein
MDDQRAESFIVSDIMGPPRGKWRWTGKRPTLKAPVSSVQGNYMVVELVLTDESFAGRGPVTVSYFVNDHKLDSVHYDMRGEHQFEKLVPAEWLEHDKDVTLAVEVDKMWTSPQGTDLGFVLVGAGLRQK